MLPDFERTGTGFQGDSPCFSCRWSFSSLYVHECGSSGFLGSSQRLANKGQAAMSSTCPDIELQYHWAKKLLTDTSTAMASNQRAGEAGLRVECRPIKFLNCVLLWRLCLSDIRANERCHVVEKYLKHVKPAHFHDAAWQLISFFYWYKEKKKSSLCSATVNICMWKRYSGVSI